jgi:hypothetical protein
VEDVVLIVKGLPLADVEALIDRTQVTEQILLPCRTDFADRNLSKYPRVGESDVRIREMTIWNS